MQKYRIKIFRMQRWGSRCRYIRKSSVKIHCNLNAHKEQYLWIVHIPEEKILMSVQDNITPIKLITVLIFLNIQESTGPILSVQVRHVPDLQNKQMNT